MATAAQVKALFESYKNGDDARFKAIATQIMAYEKNKGNTNFAKDLDDLIKGFSKRIDNKISSTSVVPIVAPQGELSGLFEAKYSSIKLENLILSDNLSIKLNRVVKEQQEQQKLREYGLQPKSKLLLLGLPGTGKTMTAEALAGQLHLPLFTIQLDGLISKYMGEASAKLRIIFDQIKKVRGIYFFDEFDAIGGSRELMNDVGEMRRILNSFLQFFENSRTDSLIIAATNHEKLLDKALFRRFDDVLRYEIPNADLMKKTFFKYLRKEDFKNIDIDSLVKEYSGFSYAELSKVCENAIKKNILDGDEIDTRLISELMNEAKEQKE